MVLLFLVSHCFSVIIPNFPWLILFRVFYELIEYGILQRISLVVENLLSIHYTDATTALATIHSTCVIYWEWFGMRRQHQAHCDWTLVVNSASSTGKWVWAKVCWCQFQLCTWNVPAAFCRPQWLKYLWSEMGSLSWLLVTYSNIFVAHTLNWTCFVYIIYYNVEKML